MCTFLDLYETLAGFVMFRLYHDMGMKYPPNMEDSSLDATLAAVEHAALKPKPLTEKVGYHWD